MPKNSTHTKSTNTLKNDKPLAGLLGCLSGWQLRTRALYSAEICSFWNKMVKNLKSNNKNQRRNRHT